MAVCGPAPTGRACGASKTGRSQLYTTADGLSSNQIRSLVEDRDGTLWIGTFGGGLNALRNGHFFSVTAQEGLLSDNVSHVEDDGHGSLWLSTTRGICRVRKQDLNDFVVRENQVHQAGELWRGGRTAKRAVRSRLSDQPRRHANRATAACGFPPAAAWRCWIRTNARRASTHRWFICSTSRWMDVPSPPNKPADLPPGDGRVQFRYTGINLSAPERVRYSYRLEGLDRDWVTSVARRVTNYNSLPHGQYRFVVRAGIPGGPSSETAFAFVLRAAFLRDRLVPLSLRGAGRARPSGDSSVCACVRSGSASRWCWKNARGWRARFTTRWRRASSASRRNSMRWRLRSTATWMSRASIWTWRARWCGTV